MRRLLLLVLQVPREFSPHNISWNWREIAQQNCSLLGFASSVHNMATGEFGDDSCSSSDRFDIDIDDIMTL